MVAKGRDGIGAENIQTLAELGYDYAELPLAEMMVLDPAAFREISGQLKAAGLRCEVCNNLFPRHFRLTGAEADKRADTLDYFHRALDRATAIGAGKVVFGSGPAKTVPDGFPLSDGFKQVAELCGELGDTAEEFGVTVVIEPLNRLECNVVNTYAEGCRLAQEVKHPNVRVLVDYYHLFMENEPTANLIQGGEYLRHVHFGWSKKRVYPDAAGIAECEPFFAALRCIGYDDTLSCEAYSDRFADDAKRVLGLLKGYFNG